MEFTAEFDLYMKRKSRYESNLTKAYALLWEHCNRTMQSKVEARSDYEANIKGNPIELLKAVKQHALNYQEHRYKMSIIHDALRTVLSCKQRGGTATGLHTPIQDVKGRIGLTHWRTTRVNQVHEEDGWLH